MAENKNHLGLDKYQIAVIKSNFNSTKPIRKLIEKNEAKMKAAGERFEKAIAVAKEKYDNATKDLRDETQAYQTQIERLDQFTRSTTKQVCGLELSSEQVMEFLDNPTAYSCYVQKMQGKDMFENQPETEEPTDDCFPENLTESQAI